MFLSEQPGGSRPTLRHVRVSPAADIACPLPHAAMRAFDQVGRRQALVQADGIFSRCNVNISWVPSPQASRRRSVIVLQLARDLLQSLLAFLGAGKLKGRAHQPARLLLLFLGQFIHDVLQLAATGYRIPPWRLFFVWVF